MYAQYGDDVYTRGLNVYTTIKAEDQNVAYRALRKGIMDFERRQIYRGPEKFVTLPADPKELDDAIDDALIDHPDNDEVMSAVVLDANPRKITAIRQNGDAFDIVGEGLRACPVRPVRQSTAQHQDPPWRNHSRGAKPQGHLGNHPVARG